MDDDSSGLLVVSQSAWYQIERYVFSDPLRLFNSVAATPTFLGLILVSLATCS